MTSKLSSNFNKVSLDASYGYMRILTADQLGGRPHTIVVTVLVNLEPFGVSRVESGAITVA